MPGLREPPGELLAKTLDRDPGLLQRVAVAQGDGVVLHRLVVDGHADALRILVGNLLDNAVKYTPVGGTVDLAIRASAAGAELSVEDSGPGIAVEERDRVLDRFYRASGAEASGSGLGLAIVKAIADLHGATLALTRSERLGGLRVVVTLPARVS